MRGRYQTRPVPQVSRPASPQRVVRAGPPLVAMGPLRGRRLEALSGYQLEDLRDWTDAELARARGDEARTKQLEAQAQAVQVERERRWAALVDPKPRLAGDR